MRRIALSALACLALAGCQKPDHINLGQTADGKPRKQIWFSRQARRDALGLNKPAPPGAGAGLPVPVASAQDVLEGPAYVGLRRDGRCVVAGKAVADEEVAARLGFVRAERLKLGSGDVETVTVLTESQVPMDRVFRAMSCGHQAGFTKIGWQLVEAVPLPDPEPLAAALPQDEGRLIVSVGAQGALRLGAEAVEPAALAARLQAAADERKAQSLPPPAVSLLADRDAPLSRIREVLAACDAAGISAVALGSPVPVAPAQPVSAGAMDASEAYRNWRFGLEDRDIDFTEGPPAYWYFGLYHAWVDEEAMLQQELRSRILNRQRVRHFGAKISRHVGQMGQLLAAVDAGRGAALQGIAADYAAGTREVVEGQASLDAVRFRLQGLQKRMTKEFPPETVSFPADLKLPAPEGKAP